MYSSATAKPTHLEEKLHTKQQHKFSRSEESLPRAK